LARSRTASVAFPEFCWQTFPHTIEWSRGRAIVDEPVEGFRTPGEVATTAELLKFLIDRTGYIKQLEAEDTPEALLAHRESARTREWLPWTPAIAAKRSISFSDHSALVSDAVSVR